MSVIYENVGEEKEKEGAGDGEVLRRAGKKRRRSRKMTERRMNVLEDRSSIPRDV